MDAGFIDIVFRIEFLHLYILYFLIYFLIVFYFLVMSSDAEYRSNILQVYVAEPREGDIYIFDLVRIEFVSESASREEVVSAFKVDANGDIYTDLEQYREYSGGYFNATIRVIDQKRQETYATVIVSGVAYELGNY